MKEEGLAAGLRCVSSVTLPMGSREDRFPSAEHEVAPLRILPEFMITLDEATQSVQPRWPGQPDSALRAFPDAAALGNPEEAAHAAIQMLYALRRRLELLISLPLHGDPAAIRSDVRDLAHMR